MRSGWFRHVLTALTACVFPYPDRTFRYKSHVNARSKLTEQNAPNFAWFVSPFLFHDTVENKWNIMKQNASSFLCWELMAQWGSVVRIQLILKEWTCLNFTIVETNSFRLPDATWCSVSVGLWGELFRMWGCIAAMIFSCHSCDAPLSHSYFPCL